MNGFRYLFMILICVSMMFFIGIWAGFGTTNVNVAVMTKPKKSYLLKSVLDIKSRFLKSRYVLLVMLVDFCIFYLIIVGYDNESREDSDDFTPFMPYLKGHKYLFFKYAIILATCPSFGPAIEIVFNVHSWHSPPNSQSLTMYT